MDQWEEWEQVNAGVEQFKLAVAGMRRQATNAVSGHGDLSHLHRMREQLHAQAVAILATLDALLTDEEPDPNERRGVELYALMRRNKKWMEAYLKEQK